MYGWVGRLLRVNLTTGECRVEKLDPVMARDYIGARGLASKILYNEVDPQVDPLSPENKLIFMTGPLTGTSAISGSRYNVVTKSPLTGTIAASNSGGYFAGELKYAGYDGIIFEGKASEPVYLYIENDRVEIRPAGHVWGKTTHETEDILKSEAPAGAKVACIGPAGEKLVRFACVVNDKNRAAGRSGVGAVMGSKNLKAVVVRGTGGIKIADPEGFRQAVKAALEKIKNNPVTHGGLPDYGTAVLVNVINAHGAFPTRNFQTGVFPGAEKISGETLAATYLVRKKGCLACPIACGRATLVPEGPYAGHGEGPEYEAIWAMGADCGVDDLAAITKANYYANELGYDPITFGATLACAMELYEKGYLPAQDTELELEFGNARTLVEAARKVGYREGIGDLLAEGSYRLAERYGHPELSMSTKKQEYPAYDPRAIQGIGLNYATTNRGGCHVRGYTIASEVLGIPVQTDPLVTEGKAGLVKTFQDLTALVDSTGICLFVTFALGASDVVSMLAPATGIPYTEEAGMLAGERIFNLERLFNLAAGLTRADDTLAPRILQEPLPEGPAKGRVNRLDEMLDEYYRVRGWDEEGRPTEATKQRLGI
ncbi:MAG: aldehyde ferredoxin oxidoreductase family protein [Thermanaeromonas sp.]|uniref:aldehyde ferredoxin oxidoreductase family protein n=1 Tax=Thermanaeromonas sp. TaxID=2003697 RepID=UPI00243E26ED|nr:aldehyde ferredoxin oxidoreductase family protein [Thermanaeromonas sp.]MCG0278024.1 aldehyde ferredoxin oxidoreductase family protein [Thermanaeromonas sp.]